MSERKRANASVQEQASIGDKIKKFRVPIVILLLWLAIVGYQVAAQRGVVGDPGDGCPGHWHHMLDVHIDGEELTFDPNVNRIFSDSAGGFHLHDDTGRVHYHPGTERCIPLEDALAFLGLDVDADGMTVSSQFHYRTTAPVAGTYATNDTHELRVYHAEWDYGANERGDFQMVKNVNKLLEQQIGNGDSILITYVPKDVDGSVIDAQMADSGAIGESYIPAKKDIFVPIMATTLFAGVGILVWSKFRVA